MTLSKSFCLRVHRPRNRARTNKSSKQRVVRGKHPALCTFIDSHYLRSRSSLISNWHLKIQYTSGSVQSIFSPLYREQLPPIKHFLDISLKAAGFYFKDQNLFFKLCLWQNFTGCNFNWLFIVWYGTDRRNTIFCAYNFNTLIGSSQ